MQCTGCGIDRSDEDFGFRNKAKGTRHSRCKHCVRVYSQVHYTHNKSDYMRRGVVNAEAKRKELFVKLYEYLREHPCIDCGEADPLVLDFDHRDRATKLQNVSNMRRWCYSWGKILAEIAKCDVRCANCHRRRTAKQCGWHYPEINAQPPTIPSAQESM